MEVTMDPKVLFENISKEVNSALAKAFDKVEELSKYSSLKFKINSLRGDIKDVKATMGDYVSAHREEFKGHPELVTQLKKITDIESLIANLESELANMKEKDEDSE